MPEGVSLRDLGEHRLKDLQRKSRLFQLVTANLPADFPPLKTIDSGPHNLPIQPTPLIGREREIRAVQQLIEREDVRLLTLSGPGGSGKTRLGLQVATELIDHFIDGIYCVNLAPISDPDLVVPTIALTLEVKERGMRPMLEVLQAFLQEQRLLLLLDNFEQVVAAASRLSDLLAACPHLKLLVTSRAMLHLSGEHEFVVPPLSLPDLQDLPPPDHLAQFEAIRLFVERAQAVKSDFALTEENAAAIAAICHQLDGLPLAIELPAGRSKLFPPQALLSRLRNRLKLLVGGAQDLPTRQQTLRATIAWSYDLLEEPEQRLFGRLAVFVGGFTLVAAEAVYAASGGLEGDILDSVAGLVDKSLLRQEEQAKSEPRFLRLETIREYALERLEESGEAEAIRLQHASFFLAMAEEAEPKIRSGEQSTWFTRLEAEHDNLRAALRWTLEHRETEMGLRLVGALFAFWRSCNHTREGRSWLEQVLEQPGVQPLTTARAKALFGAGTMAFFHGDFAASRQMLEESVSIGRELGAAGKRNLAHALTMLGQVILLQGHPATACELAGEGVRLFQEVGEAWGRALALLHLGKATVELGDLAAARSLLAESAQLFRKVGDRQRLALPVDMLGMVALRQGDYATARTQFEQALAVAREMGDAQFIADALAHLGAVALRLGNYHESAALYQQSLAVNREQGYKHGIAEDLAGLAEVASLTGQPERAARLCGGVETLREASHTGLSPQRRTADDRIVCDIRAQLDDAAFAQAWEEGRAMELSQAIAIAIEMKDTSPAATAGREFGEAEAASTALRCPPSLSFGPGVRCSSIRRPL